MRVTVASISSQEPLRLGHSATVGANMSVRVVVIGGGYAGVMTANRLASADVGVGVVLVNPRSHFVERIRLHQMAAGTGTAALDFSEVLHPAVELRVGTASSIGEHHVALADGDTLAYDYLVYALGSVSAKPNGLGEAYAVDEYESATELASKLSSLRDGETVTVVGGGYTGIETAAEIAEAYPNAAVRLVSASPVAQSVPERNRRRFRRGLKRLGVDVVEGTAVALIEGCTVWAGPFAAPTLARDSGLPVDELGRLITDSTLTCVGRPSIVGVGDAAAPVAPHIRMSAQAAQPLGAHGADTILARIAGNTPEALSLGFRAQCVSLGRHDALFQVTNASDDATRIAIGGRAGAWIKEWICSSTVTWARQESEKAGSLGWRRGPR